MSVLALVMTLIQPAGLEDEPELQSICTRIGST
jgi:hypothetical protein